MNSKARLILGVGIIIAIALWHWRMSFPFDDAYITFRYADNIAHGHGIVWNIAGPHTEGYTNFLLVLLLVPFASLHADLIIVSQLIGIISTILTAITIYKLSEEITESNIVPIFSSLLYLCLPFTWANAFSALETSLFVLLTTVTCYYSIKAEWKTAFIFASLSTLARPDGALAGSIVALSIFILERSTSERNRALQAMLLYFILPMLGYALFKFFYFGDLFPNSFYIKTEAGLHGIPGIKDFARHNFVLLVLSAYAVYRNFNATRKLLPILLWSFSLLLFYLWPEPIQGFYYRFEWAAVPGIVLLAGLSFSENTRGRKQWKFILPLFLVLVAAQIWFSVTRLRTDLTLATIDRGREIYREVGLALHSLPHHESMTFAYQDAGAIPYYSEMQNIDLVGLNTTSIAKSHSNEEMLNILQTMKPDIILVPAYHDKGPCWNVFHFGHGKAGTIIPLMMQNPFIRDYQVVGRITYLGYDILCYVLPSNAAEVQEGFSKYSWFVSGPIPCLE